MDSGLGVPHLRSCVGCAAGAVMEAKTNAAQMNFKLTPAMILDALHRFR
jgi:hypothetical protein